MKIAVASGKGGTGKTTVAVSLALTAAGRVQLLDCDVEEPNAHLFVQPLLHHAAPVTIPVPCIDPALCDGCGECSRACAFGALACMGGPPLVFPELCHGCGACSLVCPQQAVHEGPRRIGVVEWGELPSGLPFVQGRLDVGQPMAPPVIAAVKRHADPQRTVVIDCPPGTACPFMAAVRGADLALLVTEPTPFGLADLVLAVAALRQLQMPFGVVVNRAGAGDARVHDYCADSGIPLVAQIPDDRRVAEGYARGAPAVVAVPPLRPLFEQLHRDLEAGCLTGRPPASRARRRKEVPQ